MRRTPTALELQCLTIGLEFTTVAASGGGHVEDDALAHYRAQGWMGGNSEGHISSSILRTLILPVLVELNPFQFDPDTPYLHALGPLIDMCTRGVGAKTALPGERTERQSQLRECLLRRFSRPDDEGLQQDFQRVTELCRSLWSPRMPTHLRIADFLAATTESTWARLFDAAVLDMWLFKHGWPDLELTNGVSFLLVEVKARDKLHASQLERLPWLARFGFDIEVIRIIR